MASMSKAKKKNIPKSIHEMSQETLQETLKKKRECNAKALRTVEKMCETSVDEEWFLHNLQFINQCHFEDATVERAITNLCGYPLCDQKLGKVPAQQYHISTRYNKVFDITERKNFCSSCCYKSAMHVKKQLFTSPLWFRDQEVIPKYTVLKTMKSSLGEEVVFLPDKIKPDFMDKNISAEKLVDAYKDVSVEQSANVDKNFENLQEKCSNLVINDCKIDSSETKVLEKSCNTVTKSKIKNYTASEKNNVNNHNAVEVKIEVNRNAIVENENKINFDDISEVKCLTIENTTKKEKETNMSDNNSKVQEPMKEAKSDKTSEKTNAKIKQKNEPVDTITKVEKCIFEWFSLDTLFHLYGESKLKELFQDKAGAIKAVLNEKLSLSGHNEKINKMIQLYGLLDTDLFSSNEIKTNLKPLPDYSILKEEGKTLEIKVTAFYQGKLQVKQPEKEETEKEEKTTAPDSDPVYLPLVDAHAQTALRRKIVLDKLNRMLPELIKVVHPHYALQLHEVRALISTFTLSAHNITFKPPEWCLIGLILIKLLSIKNKKLQSVLDSQSSETQIFVILKNYGLQRDYLNNLVQGLTDSSNLMEKINEISK